MSNTLSPQGLQLVGKLEEKKRIESVRIFTLCVRFLTCSKGSLYLGLTAYMFIEDLEVVIIIIRAT